MNEYKNLTIEQIDLALKDLSKVENSFYFLLQMLRSDVKNS